MNTVEIGDQFELKSLGIIQKLIESEDLGLFSKHIKVFQKKGYYSNLRKKNIIFDLTIEVWPPNAERYVMIYIIECKDYNHRVPVSKIEDFHSKITQVSGVNVKGVFISNSPLQEGGYNIAESTGMMVIVGESSENFKIILHKKTLNSEDVKIPFIKGTSVFFENNEEIERIEKLIDKQVLNSFEKIVDENKISYGIDKLSKENIEKIANYELDKIDLKINSDAHTLSVNKITDFLKKEYLIDFLENNEENILGKCDLKNNSIQINSKIYNTNRHLFILAHEFGHYILHQKLFIGQKLYETFDDPEYNFKTGKYDLMNPKHWIEWQANHFAASLVLPKRSFLYHFCRSQDQLNIKRGKLFVDDQTNNIFVFNEIVKKLSYIFSVSKTSIIYRLYELDLIIDKTNIKSIGKIINENKVQFYI
jgi:Zn-dependent peptidase ImmA (M78 family)